MSNPLGRLLERRSLRDAVRCALESGVGLHHATWRAEDATGEELARELIAWCREALGRMHRPYGVDSVSLALAVLGADRRPLASTHYALLRPADFYGNGPVEAETRATLCRWAEDRALGQAGARLSAVLFSWGDLTRELLLAG